MVDFERRSYHVACDIIRGNKNDIKLTIIELYGSRVFLISHRTIRKNPEIAHIPFSIILGNEIY